MSSPGAIDPNRSYFFYRNGQGPANFTHPEFIPKFLSDFPEDRQKDAEEKCGNNVECKFDFLATGNEEIALNTKVVKEDEDAVSVVLGKTESVAETLLLMTSKLNPVIRIASCSITIQMICHCVTNTDCIW